MSVLDDFIAANSLKIALISATLRIPTQPDRSTERTNICPVKAPGDPTIRLMASQFMDILEGDFPILFSRPEVIEPGEDRMVVRLSSSQELDQDLQVRDAPRVRLRTVSGQVTVVLQRVAPRDEDDCSASPRRYSVTLATGTSSAPNELRVGVDFWGRQTILAERIAVDAIAGGDRPVAPPDPLALTGVSVSATRQCGSRAAMRVTGSVRLNRRVLAGEAAVRVTVTATAGGASVPVTPTPVVVWPGAGQGTFQVRVPAGFAGLVEVQATHPTGTFTDQVDVLEVPVFQCVPRRRYLLDRRHFPFPDPCLSCPIWDFNDMGELLGTHEGLPYRMRVDGPEISFRERLGGDVRRAAMNAFGEVAGSVVGKDGRLQAFFLPAGEREKAVILKDIQLAAINDDGLMVGYRRKKDVIQAVALSVARKKGGVQITEVPLDLPKGVPTQALAVNNQGQILVLAQHDKTAEVFLFHQGKGSVIDKLGPGETVHALTDSGFFVANTRSGGGYRPFVTHAGKGGDRIEVPVLSGMEQAFAHDVDEGGLVVGRAFTEGKEPASRGFRFSLESGTEALDELVAGKEQGKVQITAGLLTNARGEILVEIARGSARGHAVLVPAK